MKYFKLFVIFIVNIILTLSVSAADYKGHGLESLSAEKIKKYAPPSISAQLSNQISKMLDVRSPGMGMLSPDNKTLYFTWGVTGQRHIWKIDGPQKFPIQLTSGTDSVQLAEVAPNGKFLIISKDVNGQENPGLFKLDLNDGSITELFRKEKVQASVAFLTDDSKYLFFTANDKKPDSYSTYKLDLSTKEISLIFEGQGNWYVADQIQNGEKLLFVNQKSSLSNEYFDYEVATKKLVPIYGQGIESDSQINYSSKKDEFIVLTEIDNFKRLYLFKNQKLKMLSDENMNFEVSGFSLDHLRKRIIYTINRDGYSELKAISAQTFKEIRLPNIKNADNVFSGSTTRDGRITMLGIDSAKSPMLSYSYNWQSQKLTQWVLPSAPEVDLKEFADEKLMSYQTRDHVKIPMFVRFPKGCKESKNCPVVVHFHGGPEAQTTAGFAPMWQIFVNQGFVVVEPNVRGSSGYGKKWIDSDNGPLRESVINDIPDAALWIKENWKNKKGESPKVGVMGWSYGGYSTLLAMTRFSGVYDAGVALVGMSNLVSFIKNTAPYRRALRISEYGDPEKDLVAMENLSPINYVKKVKNPLMIIQGANDPRVPVGEALQMHEALLSKNIPSELLIFADEGHGSAKKENRILEIGNTIEFFKKHLYPK